MRAKMSVKRLSVVAALLSVTVAAGGAFAQKKKSPGSDICVAKNMTLFEDAQYTSIQAAVNAAKAGQVIEILDESVYEEQVTIDGRDRSPWPGVTGNKNGITIRYVVPANASWNHARPTIKYRDINNTHPRSQAEAKQDNELTGAGNFETNGALRILRAKGVTIEGIAVDGGSPFTFGAAEVWCGPSGGNCSPLNHGNAAIALASASQVTIRDCDLKNAFLGIYIKDRNTGGVFGNPNPADNDMTVPLSGFGAVGGHLFEYNKVNANVVGFFFESAWDFGSTARYNLIYNNKVTNVAQWNASIDYKNGGAFMFKDMYLTPVAIYNNTFYDNTGNFIGHWQSGGQHLIFNNIFSKSTPSGNETHMSLDGKFPNRMHNNVFSVDATKLDVQCGSDMNCTQNSALAPGGCWVSAIQSTPGGFAVLQGKETNLTTCNNPSQTIPTRMVSPGAKFTAFTALGSSIAIAIDTVTNVNRWLQTEGVSKTSPVTYTQVSLFKSLSETNPDFLVPNWDNTLVQQYIKNQGWTVAGIRNNDGSMADLGAIPSTGVRQTTVARIMPTGVVLLSGGGANADANFSLKINNGTITTPKIKMLRWIAPIPENNTDATNWPNRLTPIDVNSITAVSNTSTLKVGDNSLRFATGKTAVPNFGFVEVIAEGTDKNGNPVMSDVGFLPYRKLEYFLDITVLDGTTAVTTVTAGKAYTIRVERRCPPNGQCPSTLDEIEYRLLSDPTAFIRNNTGDTLALRKNETFPATYSNVFFFRAGAETIFASGVFTVGGQRAVFSGTLDITVNPGEPVQTVFTDPIPLSQLGSAPAAIINRGARYPVKVQVKDRFDNPIKSAVPVKLEIIPAVSVGVSNDCQTCAQILGAATVNTDTTGTATFTVQTTGMAQTGKTFDMTATIPGVTQTYNDNKARLRVGKPMDALQVFYSDNGTGKNWETYYKPDAKIDANVGEWVEVTVKVVGGDTVKYNHSDKIYVMVVPDGDFVFSADKSGTPISADNVFELINGTVTFYISTKGAGSNDVTGRIDVYAWNKASNSADYSINAGGRGNITFHGISSDILYAVVYGNGEGQPDSVLVMYDASTNLAGSNKPSEVKLNWGKAGVDAPLIATGAAVTVQGANVLKAVFTGAARPKGYTRIDGAGRGLAEVTGGAGGATSVENKFVVYDGIGPLMAVWDDDRDGAGLVGPKLYSNDAGNAVDTLDMPVSEPLKGAGAGLTKIMYKASASGTPVTLPVVGIAGTNPYKVVVSAAGGVHPEEGGWIRFDPADGVSDDAAGSAIGPGADKIRDNGPHADNRWVQLRLKELPPDVIEAWYTGNSATGKPDYAYVKFNKRINLSRWFMGGSVKIDNEKVAAISDEAALASLFAVIGDGDVLKIDLSAVFRSPQSSIRTSGLMRFTLTYSPDLGWYTMVGEAKDKAAPVLSRPAVLRVGSASGDGAAYPDTLVVYYSEQIDAASVGSNITATPLTLRSSSSGGSFEPELRLLDFAYDLNAGFYRARYLAPYGFPAGKYPETGDFVHINHLAGIGDYQDPSNVQDAEDNLWQPLTVIRYSVPDNPADLRFTVTVSNNPLNRGGGDKVEVVMAFVNAEGLDIKASVIVYDNRGNVVLASDLYGMDAVIWRWDGYDKKGRLVDAGTYRFKAVCKVTVNGRQLSYAAEKSIGVASDAGNTANAPAGSVSGGFTVGANPAVRLSGGVSFYWDGVAIKGGSLLVYDASGNLVKRAAVSGDPASGATGRRRVGGWDLTDVRGGSVADGSYAVKGTVVTAAGKKRFVSAVIGVSR